MNLLPALSLIVGLWNVNKTTCLKNGAIYKTTGWSLEFNESGEFVSRSQLSRCSRVSKHLFSIDQNKIFISNGEMHKVCGAIEKVYKIPAFELSYTLTETLILQGHNSYCQGLADYEFMKSL